MKEPVAIATDGFSERVAARASGLAPAERRVAEQLLDVGPEAMLLSAAALAEQLGTSDATVVRTAQALGYRGMGELRRAMVASTDSPPIGERLRRTLEQHPGTDLFATTIRDHHGALDALTRNVTPEGFQDAVAVLAGGTRIVWRGVGPSAHLAGYGQLMSQRIGRPSCSLVHTGTSFADELLALAARDVVVVLAYGRLQSHVRVLLDRASAVGAPVVLITDSLGRRLSGSVAAVLECGRGVPGFFASHGTTLVVIEALILALAATDRDRSARSLSKLNEFRGALAGRRLDVDAP